MGPFGSITGHACGTAFGRDDVQGPFSQLPLGVVIVSQAPHPATIQKMGLLKYDVTQNAGISLKGFMVKPDINPSTCTTWRSEGADKDAVQSEGMTDL